MSATIGTRCSTTSLKAALETACGGEPLGPLAPSRFLAPCDILLPMPEAGADARALPTALPDGAFLRKLAAPVARASLRILTHGGIRRLDCHALVDGTLATATPLDAEGYEIGLLTRPDTTAELVADALGLEQDTPDLGVVLTLPVPAFWVLCALADGLRQIELEALLRRRTGDPRGIDADTLYQRLLDGASSLDPRWLSSLLMCLLGPSATREDELPPMLTLLTSKGVVATESGMIRAATTFGTVMANLQVPLAGAHLDLARTDGLRREVVLLRCLGAVFAIEIDRATSSAELRSFTGRGLARHVRDVLDPFLVPAKSTPTPPAGATRRFCGRCGAPIGPAHKFCGRCGAAIEE